MRTRHSGRTGLWKRKPGYSQQFPCCGRFAERISISFQFMFLSGYPIPIQAFATLPVSCGLCQRKLCLPVATITLLNSAQPPTQTIARRVENSLVTAFFFSHLWLQQRWRATAREDTYSGESAWDQLKPLDWFQGVAGGGNKTTNKSKKTLIRIFRNIFWALSEGLTGLLTKN